jgi:hypothetical protein
LLKKKITKENPLPQPLLPYLQKLRLAIKYKINSMKSFISLESSFLLLKETAIKKLFVKLAKNGILHNNRF